MHIPLSALCLFFFIFLHFAAPDAPDAGPDAPAAGPDAPAAGPDAPAAGPEAAPDAASALFALPSNNATTKFAFSRAFEYSTRIPFNSPRSRSTSGYLIASS